MKEKPIRQNVAKLEEIAGILGYLFQGADKRGKKKVEDAAALTGEVAMSLLDDSYVYRKECEKYDAESIKKGIEPPPR